MIVVAIIGILAAIALPAYQNYVIKSRRTDGQAALMGLQMAQERFRANCPHYAAALGASRVCGTTAANSTVIYSSNSPDGHYTIAIDAASANTFTASAAPQGAQAADSVCVASTFKINEKGPNGNSECWSR